LSNVSLGIFVAALTMPGARIGGAEDVGHVTAPQAANLRGAYTMQQANTRRYVDAHEYEGRDFAVVTRPGQPNDTQTWVFILVGNDTYRIRQKSSGRYLDAHEIETNDYRVVTRPYQPNDSQEWILTRAGNSRYRIRQKSSSRYLDAHDTANWDFGVVTRPAQPNDTQVWEIQGARS
jgi:hypothetical protein